MRLAGFVFHRQRGVHTLRSLLEQVAQVAQQREVAELAGGEEFLPRGAFQRLDFFGAGTLADLRPGPSELRFPRFRRSEVALDQLAQRRRVWRVEQVDRVHQLELRGLAAVLRQLVFVEPR